ncbi:MAG: pyrimidine-nucleoside phosphorylase [Bacillota bacterium]
MRMYDIIHKKREGLALSRAEIEYFIHGYTRGEIPDYQVSALLMAIYFRGLNPEETAALTMAMVDSGDRADLSALPGRKVDKHSTGGVGDKTTLVLAPLVAAAGAPVAKMSGRGLGHTGGTVDKLEAIPGFRVDLTTGEFLAQVRRVGVAVVAQTGQLAPADKKLYALRDVTATVDSIPLIASSIMSKKIASGAGAIVLDVKTGSGAFMQKKEDAFALARAMVDIGKLTGRRTVALVTDMDQPLGRTVGNALEVKEAVETLRGNGPRDLESLCLELGAHLLVLGGVAENTGEAVARLWGLLHHGTALAKFKEFISAQGGDPGVADYPDQLPAAAGRSAAAAPRRGYVTGIDAAKVGRAAMLLGAGRERKDSVIDLAVGLVLNKKVGDRVCEGETLAELHYNARDRLEEAAALLREAYHIGDEAPRQRPLVLGTVN